MRYDKVEKRHEEILQLLETYDSVTNAQLCKRLKCSESTIRNDLTYLEKEGLLLRTFGGAARKDQGANNAIDLNSREALNLPEKQEIALCVVREILKPHMTVILDAGTTCKVIAEEIARQRVPLNVVTNSFYVAKALMPAIEEVNLYLLGGLYDRERGRFHDPYAKNPMEYTHADLFVMAVNGINGDAGAMLTGIDEIPVKREYLKNAERCVAVADYSKVGRNSVRTLAALEEIDTLVVDSKASEKEVKKLQEKGLRVIRAHSL